MTLLSRIKSKLKSNFSDGSKQSTAVPVFEYFGCADELLGPSVRGWVSYVDESLNPVMLKITKGDEVQYILANEERSDVLSSGRVNSPFCGYSAKFSDDNYAKAVVEVLTSLGELTQPAPSYKNRKVFFIHIPKAAGSSINDLMGSVVDGPFYTHIEGLRDQWGEIKDSNFLSGHIRYKEYEREFSKHDYVVFAFLREPSSHLRSHMNWVRRLAEPELVNKRASHADIVHKIADDLAILDFTNVDSLSSYVTDIRPIAYGLFDNCQVRFLSAVEPNERVTQQHLDQAIENLRHLHFVGISEQSRESQKKLANLLGFDIKGTETKSNVNTYDYGLDIRDERIIEVLKPLIQYDQELYNVAKDIFSKF